jgi:mono/diheme cytochrome c family protein
VFDENERMFNRILALACLFILIATGIVACNAPRNPDAASVTPVNQPLPTLDPARVARGEALYTQHCASCHGANLQGQPNWKQPLPSGKYPSPPHDDTGHTWHHPDAVLIDIILNGGNGTQGKIPSDMPSFKHVLSEDDAITILTFFKSRWSLQSRQYQLQMTGQHK